MVKTPTPGMNAAGANKAITMGSPKSTPILQNTAIGIGNTPPSHPTIVNRPGSTPAPSIEVVLLSKNQQKRIQFGDDVDVFSLGEIYLNDLSDIRVFEVTNSRLHRVHIHLKAEMRKPFQTSICNFQLENENLASVAEIASLSDSTSSVDDFNHVPVSVLRLSSKNVLCAENVYLSEGYNELFNHIATIDTLVLEPKETRRVVFSFCAKLTPHHQPTPSFPSSAFSFSHHADSSEEERMHLNETSCLVLTGRLVVNVQSEESSSLADVVIPLQAHICRSLLRLDVKELHFDDCIPGGSFVKDFTVWNRSEIPLLFKLITSMESTQDILTFTDYNSGYAVGNKTLQAAAYGHVRIRVTFRPIEVCRFIMECIL